MRDDNLDYTAIRRRVEAELQQDRRRGQIALFAVDVFIFCLFMLLTWVLVPATSSRFSMTDDVLAAMILLSIGWSVGLVMHAITALGIGSKGWIDRHRRRLLAREIEYARLGIDDDLLDESVLVQKAKRGGKLRLSDEGEMLDIVDDHYIGDEEPRQQRQ